MVSFMLAALPVADAHLSVAAPLQSSLGGLAHDAVAATIQWVKWLVESSGVLLALVG
ncbi:hypothetical protein BJ973_005688 [Actinoplanes tereljensis]|uniref:Uncharacterized protein n=1 Tax=Paractinoplanes tereljensis TaxID=571912 RepID=A0A919TYM0_9ACTN|nr:hypothetical protein [Actinoplanes tereljensis]GIF26329.1 hypothetical protein Ate02nite_90590 [Actinoplanes tereljensis]